MFYLRGMLDQSFELPAITSYTTYTKAEYIIMHPSIKNIVFFFVVDHRLLIYTHCSYS